MTSPPISSDGTIARVLAEFARRAGPWCDDPREVEAALRDLCPAATSRELAVIVDAVRRGIPKKLRAVGTPISAVLLARRWTESSSIDEALALWAVHAWAAALGVRTMSEQLSEATGSAGAGTSKTVPAHDTTPTETTTTATRTTATQTTGGGTVPGRDTPPATLVSQKKSGRRVIWRIAWICGFVLLASCAGLIYLGSLYDRQQSDAAGAGDRALAEKRWADAHADYAKAIDGDSTPAHVWYSDGIALEHLGNLDDAAADFAHAMQADPTDGKAAFERGYVLAAKGDYANALTAYERAVKLTPANGTAWGNLGLVQERLGRYRDALASSEKAQMYGVTAAHGGSELACTAAFRLNDRAEVPACAAAVRSVTNDAFLWDADGWSLLSTNALPCDAAKSAFSRSIAIDKNEVEAIRGFAVCDVREGDVRDADGILEQAARSFPQSATVWNDLGVARARLGDARGAKAAYDRALAIDPKFPTALANLSRLLRANPALAGGGR